MKRIITILVTIIIGCFDFAQAQSQITTQRDSATESMQVAISEVFYSAIERVLSKTCEDSAAYNTYFIVRFHIAGYDSVRDFATSLHDSRMNKLIAEELDKSLQLMKKSKLDYTVFEGMDISIPVAILLNTGKKDAAVNVVMPIKNLYMMPYIFVDRHNKMIKSNARIIKCYQLLPVVWPEIQTGWERPRFVPAKKKKPGLAM
jgi:hypothetical protein